MENHVLQCDRCLHFKQKLQNSEVNPIDITYPMEVVHIDYLAIESGKSDKNSNILVVTDHLTRYTQVFITSSQTVKATTETLEIFQTRDKISKGS